MLAGAVMWTLLSSVQWKFTATTAETAGAYNYPGKRITVSFCLNEMNKERSCFLTGRSLGPSPYKH